MSTKTKDHVPLCLQALLGTELWVKVWWRRQHGTGTLSMLRIQVLCVYLVDWLENSGFCCKGTFGLYGTFLRLSPLASDWFAFGCPACCLVASTLPTPALTCAQSHKEFFLPSLKEVTSLQFTWNILCSNCYCSSLASHYLSSLTAASPFSCLQSLSLPTYFIVIRTMYLNQKHNFITHLFCRKNKDISTWEDDSWTWYPEIFLSLVPDFPTSLVSCPFSVGTLYFRDWLGHTVRQILLTIEPRMGSP